MYTLTVGKVKVQKSTKENEANTLYLWGAGLHPSLQIRRVLSQHLTSQAHAHVCTHMNTHLWPTFMKHVTQHRYMFTVVLIMHVHTHNLDVEGLERGLFQRRKAGPKPGVWPLCACQQRVSGLVATPTCLDGQGWLPHLPRVHR